MKYKYVIFDLDGTLLDTQDGVISAIIQTLTENHMDIPSPDILKSMIGPPIQESFRKIYELSDEKAMTIANQFRNHYKTDQFLLRATPYPGIYELMDFLISVGILIGIATYKREDYARRLLIKKNFDQYTKFIYGSDSNGFLKKKDIICRCMNKMGCTIPGEAVFIGDSISDGTSANMAGIDFIAVTYGYGFRHAGDALSFNPIGIANVCSDVKSFLQ